MRAASASEKDLAAGMALSDAVTDAQSKTGVTITSFHDPTAVEYAVILALIIVVCITVVTGHISSPINPELSAIAAKMQSSVDAIGATTIP